MNKETREPPSQIDDASYYAIIPGPVLNSDEIPDGAKILYGVISTLTKREGYCYARNEMLAARVRKEPDTVSRLVSKLDKAGFVHVEVIRDPETKTVLERRIYPVMDIALMSWKKSRDPIGKKSDTPTGNLSDTPPGKKAEESNKDSSIPPIVPQGDGRSERETRKSMPKHKPDRFEGFWNYYPRHDDRASAVRAWDRLKPSDELIKEMGTALTWQKKLPQWQDKTKIPYACRWLKNQRWLDERPTTALSENEIRGWAEDREVL
ncbi:MAG: helix-turn-helix domain-containing protein [Oscillospiraceae bacterium]|nr:helix-turn-helix domain-containing protein [Oscillospiraceae bacterium]